VGNLWNDIKHSLHLLTKNPGFTFAAVAALALGIGAAEEPLRKTFLSAPAVRKVLGETADEGLIEVDPGVSTIGINGNQKVR
jgi:hypothetical protein